MASTPSSNASDLKSIILAQPHARPFGSGVANSKFELPSSPGWKKRWVELQPSRELASGELLDKWVSPAWRASDVPLTFHSDQTPLSTKSMMSMMDWVNEEGAILQYLFQDGLCLTAGELLRHPRGRQVPRLLLPLALQIRPEVNSASLAHRPANMRPQWLIQSDQVVATVLLAIERVNRGFHDERPCRRGLCRHQRGRGREPAVALERYPQNDMSIVRWRNARGQFHA